jgi:hypothetical protein
VNFRSITLILEHVESPADQRGEPDQSLGRDTQHHARIPISFAKFVDTRDFLRKVRAPMIHQSTNFYTRQRSALKARAWDLLIPCGAPPRAFDDVT